jgi:hypothetical protein
MSVTTTRNGTAHGWNARQDLFCGIYIGKASPRDWRAPCYAVKDWRFKILERFTDSPSTSFADYKVLSKYSR